MLDHDDFAQFHRKQMNMDIENQDRKWHRLNIRQDDLSTLRIGVALLVLLVFAAVLDIFLSSGIKEKTVITHAVSGNVEQDGG